MEQISHPLEPIYDASSRILILGTMPSPKSRETGFYYGHPQNRFWKIVPALWGEEDPGTNEARRAFLLRRHIALWDVLRSCRITGADDGSIRDPVPNNLEQVLSASPIRAIFTTGAKAAQLYRRLCQPTLRRAAIPLPSTSPANCRYYSYSSLLEAYRVLLPYLEGPQASVQNP